MIPIFREFIKFNFKYYSNLIFAKAFCVLYLKVLEKYNTNFLLKNKV